MTIRHLEIFVTAMGCGKMSRAAEKLYITQPPVSQAIRELEDYYGICLFERLSRQLYLTDGGRMFLFYTCYIMDFSGDMELIMRNRSNIGGLRIGVSTSVETCLLGEKLSCLETKLSGIETEVTACNISVIGEMVLKSELDVGLVEGFVNGGDIIRIPFYEDELVIAADRPHPLYEQEDLILLCLNGQNYVPGGMGSAERNQLEQMLNMKEMNLERIWSYTNTEAIKNTVTERQGFAILSRMVAKKEAAEGFLQIILEGNSMRCGIQLIYHKDKYLSEGLKTFPDVCRNQNTG